MEAIVLIAPALLIVALVRRIASAPLFATLSVCFANWADESRAMH